MLYKQNIAKKIAAIAFMAIMLSVYSVKLLHSHHHCSSASQSSVTQTLHYAALAEEPGNCAICTFEFLKSIDPAFIAYQGKRHFLLENPAYFYPIYIALVATHQPQRGPPSSAICT